MRNPQSSRPPRARRGLTLIELTLALTIFSVLGYSLMSALTLSNMLLWLDGKLDQALQWPNLTLLHRHFAHRELSWTPGDFKDAQERRAKCLPDNATLIADIFNFENPNTLDINNFDKWGPINLKPDTQMIREKIPDYLDSPTTCLFEHAYDKPPGDDVLALAAQYKIDDPFEKSTASLYSDLG